jgi:diguanylate cyclase (GGDEF)-like protein
MNQIETADTGPVTEQAPRSPRTAVLLSAFLALAFLVAASAFAVLASSTRQLGFADVLLVVAFAWLVGLDYPIGAGAAVPAQLAFVPMLFVLPLRFVPLAACAGLVLSLTFTLARGKRPHLCPNAFGACWFALPPAAILLLAGEQPFAWSHWPLYVAAFVAQSLTDLILTVFYERFVNRAGVRSLLGILGTVYAFDALLTPVALLAAGGGPYAFLALLPLTGVLHALGRERRSRLDTQSEADRLDTLAHVDDLTSAANRRSFDQRLTVELARARRSGSSLSVCALDLDHFKRYNDTFGHPAGDDLLRRVTAAWGATLRPEAMLARIGGEEFGLILPAAQLRVAEVIVERLRTATPHEVTFSAGVAVWDGTETFPELIARADEALYRAKSDGRNRLVVAA